MLKKFNKIKIQSLAFFKFFWTKKIWILVFIALYFIFFIFYIYFYVQPSIYISPNLFTDSGRTFVSACINSSKLSVSLTIKEKKQIEELVEAIFYQMSKKGTPFQIGVQFYFYKFNFIIKILWEVLEIKKNNAQSIPTERLQMIATRVVENLLNYSRTNPASKVAQFIFYYYKKLRLK